MQNIPPNVGGTHSAGFTASSSDSLTAPTSELGNSKYEASARYRMPYHSLQIDIDNYRRPKDKGPFFEDLHARFDGGEISILLGTSGRGKTTFLQVLLGTSRGSQTGCVTYRVQNADFSAKEMQKTGRVGIVAQDYALIPWLTTEENLVLPTKLNPALATPRTADVEQNIRELGLKSEVLEQFPHELSFGTRQRIAFIRCLLYEPKFLLLDETFTGLDPTNVRRMSQVLDDYVRRSGAVCLLVTHNVVQASQLGNRIYYLSRNRKLDPLRSCIISEIEQKFADDI